MRAKSLAPHLPQQVHQREARERGFSLVEVVVALALLSLILGILAEAIRGGLLADAKGGAVKRLLVAAETRLALVGVETPLEAGMREGGDGDIKWRIAVESFRDPLDAPEASGRPQVPSAYRVRVTVTSSERSLSLETIRLKPERAS